MAVVAQAPDENSTAARRARLKSRASGGVGIPVRANPELATAVGDNRYNDRLSDYSPEFYRRTRCEHARHALRDFRS